MQLNAGWNGPGIRQQAERLVDAGLIGLVILRGRSVRRADFNGEIKRVCFHIGLWG